MSFRVTRDQQKFKGVRKEIQFEPATVGGYVPLPTEQDGIRDEMVATLNRLVANYLTEDEAAQIVHANGKVIMTNDDDTIYRGRIVCFPTGNGTRHVFVQYNNAKTFNVPKAEIRFSKEPQMLNVERFPRVNYVIKQSILDVVTERVEILGHAEDNNRSRIVFKRLSDNTIVMSFEGNSPDEAERRMRKLYGENLKIDTLQHNQFDMQKLFEELRHTAIFGSEPQPL